MRIAIMQPAYLPWSGYFDLMEQVDCFVLLDDVQFSRQSWQQRNRIKSREGAQWLTVPVIHDGACDETIMQVKIDNHKPWKKKHSASILQNYSRAPYLDNYIELLDGIYGREWETLADLTIHIIDVLKTHLRINTPLVRASTYTIEGGRVDRLINLCTCLGASEYISPAGAFDYLGEGQDMANAGIQLRYHNYQPQRYKQLYPPFLTHLSAIDLLLNEGLNSPELIRTGRCLPLEPADLAGQLHDEVNEDTK